ncbi:MAG TPA: BPTI/Kunitz domain-containing protein [Polyangiaceae bacterium]
MDNQWFAARRVQIRHVRLLGILTCAWMGGCGGKTSDASFRAGDVSDDASASGGTTATSGATTSIAGKPSGIGGPEGAHCVLPFNHGTGSQMCDMIVKNYYFDIVTGECTAAEFVSGSNTCGGNANRFETLGACRAACRAPGTAECPMSAPASGAISQCLPGTVCYYKTFTSCGCNLDGSGGCVLADPTCPAATDAAGTRFVPTELPAAALPETFLCYCDVPGWFCEYHLSLD